MASEENDQQTAAEHAPGPGEATGRAEPGPPPPAANQPGDQDLPPRGQGDERGEGTAAAAPSQVEGAADLPAPDGSGVADAATGTQKTGPSGTVATPHAARAAGPGQQPDALVGRQSAPDGEVGAV